MGIVFVQGNTCCMTEYVFCYWEDICIGVLTLREHSILPPFLFLFFLVFLVGSVLLIILVFYVVVLIVFVLCVVTHAVSGVRPRFSSMVRVVHFVLLVVFVLWYRLRFPHKNDVRFVFTPVVCRMVHVLFMLFVFVFV